MLENLEKFKPPSPCEVEAIESKLKEKDVILLKSYLEDSQGWSSSDLSEALFSLGLKLSSSSISYHRAQTCRCYWKPKSQTKASVSLSKPKNKRVVTEPVIHYGISISTLIEKGFISIGETLVSLAKSYPGEAIIYDDGQIIYNETHYNSISSAAIACKKSYDPKLVSENGWSFWGVERKGTLTSLKDIRDSFISGEKHSPINKATIESTKRKEIVSISDLIQAKLIEEGETLYSPAREHILKVNKKGLKSPAGESFTTLKDAAKFAEYGDTNSDKYINGWRYWHYEKNGKLFPISKLRDILISI